MYAGLAMNMKRVSLVLLLSLVLSSTGSRAAAGPLSKLKAFCSKCMTNIALACNPAELNPFSDDFDPAQFDQAEIEGRMKRTIDVPTILITSRGKETIKLKDMLTAEQVEFLKTTFVKANWEKNFLILREISFTRKLHGGGDDFWFTERWGNEYEAFFIEKDKITVDKNHGWRRDWANRILYGSQARDIADFRDAIAFAESEVRRLTNNPKFKVKFKESSVRDNTSFAGYVVEQSETHTIIDVPPNDEGLLFLNLLRRCKYRDANWLKQKRPITLWEALHVDFWVDWYELKSR